VRVQRVDNPDVTMTGSAARMSVSVRRSMMITWRPWRVPLLGVLVVVLVHLLVLIALIFGSSVDSDLAHVPGTPRSGRRGRHWGRKVTIDKHAGSGDAVERDQAAMTIEYETTAEDIVSLQRYWYRHKMWRRWSFGFLLALANGLALGRVLAEPGFTAWSIVVYVACCGLFLLAWSMFVYTIAPLITVRSTKRMIQKGQYLGVVGRHTVRLEAGGFHETPDVSKSFRAWRSIDTLAADARYVYIVLHGGLGYIIPHRAFPNTAASDEFIAAARRFHAAGSEAGAPTSAST
jgi:hypothetical protein